MEKKFFSPVIYIIAFLFIFSSCQTKKTKPEDKPPIPGVPQPPVIVQPEPPAGSPPNQPPPTVIEPKIITPNLPGSAIHKNEKFAVIFSGGGVKAWGHVAVLKELQKFKWPVSAVAGFEWGSDCFINPVLPEFAAKELAKWA